MFKIVKRHKLINIVDRDNIDLKRRISRGSSRRFNRLAASRQVIIPLQVTMGESPTTHEITISDTDIADEGTTKVFIDAYNQFRADRQYTVLGNDIYMHKGRYIDYNRQAADDAFIAHFDNMPAGERPAKSRVICAFVDGKHRFYYILNWTDFFGASVQEGELCRRKRRQGLTDFKTLYAREASDSDTGLMNAALSEYLDMFSPLENDKVIDGVAPAKVIVSEPWLTSTIVSMIDAARNEMGDVHPVLADALDDAGYDNQLVLDHLRIPGAVHSTNCWAIRQLTTY